MLVLELLREVRDETVAEGLAVQRVIKCVPHVTHRKVGWRVHSRCENLENPK